MTEECFAQLSVGFGREEIYTEGAHTKGSKVQCPNAW